MILPLLFNKILKEQVKKVAIALQSSGKNTDLSFSAFYTVSIIRARLITRISIEVEVRYSQFILFHGRLTGNKTAEYAMGLTLPATQIRPHHYSSLDMSAKRDLEMDCFSQQSQQNGWTKTAVRSSTNSRPAHCAPNKLSASIYPAADAHRPALDPRRKKKSLYHPLTYGGGLHNPQPMKQSISSPKLSKTDQITP